MDGRRLLHGLIGVTRLVVGGVVVVFVAGWAAADARAGGAIVALAGLGYLLALQRIEAVRSAAGHPPRGDALAYLGTLRECTAWAVIVGLIVTVALGVTETGTPPWEFAAVVGAFVGLVSGCWLAIHRRFGSKPTPAAPGRPVAR